MSESANANAPKPSSSVKLVLLGEAAVGKVLLYSSCYMILTANRLLLFAHSHRLSSALSTMISRRIRNQLLAVRFPHGLSPPPTGYKVLFLADHKLFGESRDGVLYPKLSCSPQTGQPGPLIILCTRITI